MSVAHEILDELLDAIVHYSEWDIAMKARSLKRAATSGSLLTEQAVSGPHFDLCSVIRAAVPARVLVNYSLRSGTEVLQLKCVDQKVSGTSSQLCITSASSTSHLNAQVTAAITRCTLRCAA